MRVNPAVERFVKKHGATILTCVGAAGVVATSVVTAKATLKVHDILDDATVDKGSELTFWEKVNVTFPIYIPTILMSVGTIGCILGANVLNKQYQKALTSAYILLDQSYKEYRNKVTELYGKEANEKVEEAIAENKVPRQ